MGFSGDNIHSSLAHVVMCCVAGRGVSHYRNAGFIHPGMHANFFVHGIFGFFHYQSGLLDDDFRTVYIISLKAVRYLALPCLNADLRQDDPNLSTIHLLSGLIPFALSLAGEDQVALGNLIIAANIISLCHYSHTTNREWGWYTAGAACIAYFFAPQASQKFLFPLSLALMNYCAYRI